MGIATENISDISNMHFILKGEPYLLRRWISFQCEKKRYAQYTESKSTKDVTEVFQTYVDMNEKLQIEIHEYCLLCCSYKCLYIFAF